MTFDLFDGGTFPEPRPFQDVAHRELRAGFVAGHKRQVLMAPTGAGKTYLGLRLCAEALARGRSALFVCDRKTLINQTYATSLAYGMVREPNGTRWTPSIMQASNPKLDLKKRFQIASAQTLAVRGINDVFDVIVVDECHTMMEATIELVMATQAAVIGLSATPFTKGLGAIYSRVVNAATMDELVRSGVLTPMRVMTCKRPDMKGAKTTGGEWTAREAETRGVGIIGDVVAEWLKHADNRKTIVFGPTINHCEELVRQFRAAGVGADIFTAHTTEAEREVLLAEYRRPDSRIRVLVSVEALAKGFDVPDVGCVCDCRPLRKSLSTAIQMWGRGLRSSPGKVDCLLLDFSGNIIRFADDFSDVYFNGLADLDKGERLDKEVRKDGDDEEKPAKSCPACGYTPCGKKCVKCGFEAVSKSLIEHQVGDAEEVDVLRGGGKYAASRAELYAMLVTYEKARAAKRGSGNPKGAAAHRYRDLTGCWPNAFRYEEQPHVEPSAALLGKLRSLQIAFAKRMGR